MKKQKKTSKQVKSKKDLTSLKKKKTSSKKIIPKKKVKEKLTHKKTLTVKQKTYLKKVKREFKTTKEEGFFNHTFTKNLIVGYKKFNEYQGYKITNKYLSEKIEISQSTLYRLEKGKKLKSETYKKITNYFTENQSEFTQKTLFDITLHLKKYKNLSRKKFNEILQKNLNKYSFNTKTNLYDLLHIFY